VTESSNRARSLRVKVRKKGIKDSSARWLERQLNDPYVAEAKASGYRSRAAFKLMEIDEWDKGGDRLLRPGMVVVDLGAAPGGWSQVAMERVGAGGCVIALDLLEMAPLAGVDFLQGDFREDAVLAELTLRLAGRPADLVISDMAPNISGVAAVDQARSVGLAELALDFAVKHLKPQGNFLVKVFQGSGFEALVAEIRRRFVQVMIRKPEASRSRSNEVYVVAKGLKARQ